MGSCGVLAVTDSVRTFLTWQSSFHQTLSLYDFFHTSCHPGSQQTYPRQAGRDVSFPQQEQEELLSVLRFPACLCCVERVLHLCFSRSLPCHCPGSQPVAAGLFGEQINVLAQELEGVTPLPCPLVVTGGSSHTHTWCCRVEGMLQDRKTDIFTNCTGILEKLGGPGCCAPTGRAGAAEETLFLRAGLGVWSVACSSVWLSCAVPGLSLLQCVPDGFGFFVAEAVSGLLKVTMRRTCGRRSGKNLLAGFSCPGRIPPRGAAGFVGIALLHPSQVPRCHSDLCGERMGS